MGLTKAYKLENDNLKQEIENHKQSEGWRTQQNISVAKSATAEAKPVITFFDVIKNDVMTS